MRLLQTIPKVFFFTILSFWLAACGGGGGGSDDDPAPLDTTVDYDIFKVLFGTPGVSRTMMGSGPDDGGDIWSINRVITTLVTPDPADPCLAGETQQDDVLTLTDDTGLVTTSAGPACYSISGLIQETLELDETETPKVYSLLTTAGTLPLTARIGDGGLFGAWNLFDDTNGDNIYDGGAGDTITGSSTSNWRLEDQNGKAAIVISIEIRDQFGVIEGSETNTFFILPSGAITGFEINVLIVGDGTLTLTGTLN